jgi:aminomethyltransferase
MDTSDDVIRVSPLDSAHRALGARMVPFGGWDMPLSYPDGTLAEHRACRHHAVVFDVSHLGTVRVSGPGALAALQSIFTNDLGRVAPGRAQYTHLLDPADASVTDDIIVWWIDDEVFDVMPNASNTDRVVGALQAAAGDDAMSVEDVTSTRAVLAVQGPEARSLLATVNPEAAAVGRFRVEHVDINGTICTVAGTGYTGEDGVEIAIAADQAAGLWSALVAAGITPAGLGARDTLRLEAGLPLHGHELGDGITPLQAGLGWVVSWDKGDFRGREALAAERDAGPARRLVALRAADRRPPRQGDEVVRDGAVVGEVTSGNFSPELGVGIALALVAGGAEVGDTLEVSSRGSVRHLEVVTLPFVGR